MKNLNLFHSHASTISIFFFFSILKGEFSIVPTILKVFPDHVCGYSRDVLLFPVT